MSATTRSVLALMALLFSLFLLLSTTAQASTPDARKLADTIRHIPQALDNAVHVDVTSLLGHDATEARSADAGNVSGSKTVQCAFDTAAAGLAMGQPDEQQQQVLADVDDECVAVFKARKSSATTGGPVPFYTGTGAPVDVGRAWLFVGGAAIAAAALLV